MSPSEYLVVGEFRNHTQREMTLYLEMTCEEVVLAPGHEVELLAKPDPNLLPLTTDLVDGGIQIHPCRVFDPDWHIRFKGQVIRPGYPTRLAELPIGENNQCDAILEQQEPRAHDEKKVWWAPWRS